MTKQPVFHQGQIVYIPPKEGTSKNLMNRDRPAIVISRNSIAERANFISVVYLTSQDKSDMGSHIELCVNNQKSIALCEQITSIPKDEVGRILGKLKKTDMFKVSLGILWANVPEAIYDAVKAFKLLMKNI